MNLNEAVKIIRQYVPEPNAGKICLWLQEINVREANSAGLSCPNCSVPGKPFYMSPIPAEFVRLENATHECTKCHYKRNE